MAVTMPRNKTPVSELGTMQKYAFVPILNQNIVQSVIVLKADALFFASLNNLRRSLSYFAMVCLLLIIVISTVISSSIVKPIEALVRKAKEIGEGILSNPIKIKADGELQYLANALEDMRCKIKQIQFLFHFEVTHLTFFFILL